MIIKTPNLIKRKSYVLLTNLKTNQMEAWLAEVLVINKNLVDCRCLEVEPGPIT